MSALRNLQQAVAAVLLADASAPADRLRHPRLDPAAVLAIHRRHFTTSLREALAATFPAVVRLVGDGFFAYAAHEFVLRHPPASPCLADYGDEFPRFLAGFEPCAHLAYLADCARLEWLLHEAGRASTAPPLGWDAFTRIASRDSESLPRLRLDPTLHYLAASWPVDTIVETARHDGDAGWIAVEPCELFLQVRRIGRNVHSTRLTKAAFAFRRALANGESLVDALDDASAADRQFDLERALASLIDEGTVIGLSFGPTAKEES